MELHVAAYSAPFKSLLEPKTNKQFTEFLIENFFDLKELIIPCIVRDLKIEKPVFVEKPTGKIIKGNNLLVSFKIKAKNNKRVEYEVSFATKVTSQGARFTIELIENEEFPDDIDAIEDSEGSENTESKVLPFKATRPRFKAKTPGDDLEKKDK